MQRNCLKQSYGLDAQRPRFVSRIIECWACCGTGWKETTIDDATLIGNGGWCIRCSGTGKIWIELEKT